MLRVVSEPMCAASCVLGMGSGAGVVAFVSRSLTAAPVVDRFCRVTSSEWDRGKRRRVTEKNVHWIAWHAKDSAAS